MIGDSMINFVQNEQCVNSSQLPVFLNVIQVHNALFTMLKPKSFS